MVSSVASTSAVVGRRACAVLAAGSAALHAVMLTHSGSVLLAAALGAMALACLFCAHDLWRWGSTRAWCLVALMNLAMIAVHAPLPGHHHDRGGPLAAPSTMMAVATLIAAVEVAAAAAVLYSRSRALSIDRTGGQRPTHA